MVDVVVSGTDELVDDVGRLVSDVGGVTVTVGVVGWGSVTGGIVVSGGTVVAVVAGVLSKVPPSNVFPRSQLNLCD